MFKFIKDAFGELDHVVWPTSKETRKYMNYTVGAIIFTCIFLAILGYAFQWGLKALRDANPNKNSIHSMDDPATYQDVEDFLQHLNFTGSDNSENTLSPDDYEITPIFEHNGDITDTENAGTIEVIDFTPVDSNEDNAPLMIENINTTPTE